MTRHGEDREELHALLKSLHEEEELPQDLALQGLRGSRKLKPGALSLGLVIVLNNCHYAPSITRGVISVSRLFDDGFVNRFDDNNVISVSKDNLVYFMAVPRDGIFEIDMSCSNTNDSSMYAITNKRAKINLDSSLLWHCRLGHISKKRIEKLQHDGLLNSIDIESLGKCVSCLSGKMARKPYSHQVERAKDLLGLIHTDSDQAEEGPTNFALMAYSSTSSNSEVSNDSNCSSSCLENVKLLKEQNEQLLKDLRTSKLNVIAYKTGLESVEARLLVYKKSESVYEEDIKVLKRKIH
ncbi:zinc finger, CCHC-type containing protein [Tanacetum coccineum]